MDCGFYFALLRFYNGEKHLVYIDYIIVLLPLLAAVFGFIPPYGGNFNCEDTSILYPYTGDTIKTRIMVMLIIFPVAILVCSFKSLNNFYD